MVKVTDLRRALAMILTVVMLAGFMPWGLARATDMKTYYVSQNNGNDSYDGSAAMPFASIGKGIASLSAGDKLIIEGGTYDEVVSIIGKDFSQNPAIITAADGEEVIISPSTTSEAGNKAVMEIVDSKGFDISNLKIQKGTDYWHSMVIQGDSKNIKVHDNTLIGPLTGSITMRHGVLEGVEVYNNTMINLRNGYGGVLIYDASKVKVYNNIMYNCEDGVRFYGDAQYNEIYNNTFYQNTFGDITYFPIGGKIATNNIIKNNIFDSGISKTYASETFPLSDFISQNTFDYNCYGAAAIANGYVAKDNGIDTKLSFEQFVALGHEPNGFMGNPSYANPAEEDFSLNADSPCINKGADGLVTVDKLGNPRTNTDLGALEYKKTNKVKFINTPIIIDGVEDDIWALDYNVDVDIVGKSDNQASMAILADNNNLYVAVKVIDANVINTNNEYPWMDDSVEIYIDPDNLKSNYSALEGLKTSQLIFRYNDPVYVKAGNTSLPLDNVTFKIGDISGGYLLEAAIPWTDLNFDNSRTDFGLTVNVNDRDDNGEYDEIPVLGLTPGSNNWQTSANWQTFTLEKKLVEGKVIFETDCTRMSNLKDNGWEFSSGISKQGSFITDSTKSGLTDVQQGFVTKTPELGQFLVYNDSSAASDARSTLKYKPKDGTGNNISFKTIQQKSDGSGKWYFETSMKLDKVSKSSDAPESGFNFFFTFGENKVYRFAITSDNKLVTYDQQADLGSIVGDGKYHSIIVSNDGKDNVALFVDNKQVYVFKNIRTVACWDEEFVFQLMSYNSNAEGTNEVYIDNMKFVLNVSKALVPVTDKKDSLQVGSMNSIKSLCIKQIPAPTTKDYAVKFNYMYPSGQDMNWFYVWSSYNGEKYNGPIIIQNESILSILTNGNTITTKVQTDLKPDTWYELVLKYNADDTLELYIDGVKAKLGTAYNIKSYMEGETLSSIGYIGDISSTTHNGMAYYDNFAVYDNKDIVYQESFDKGNGSLAGWLLYPDTANGGYCSLSGKSMDYPVQELESIQLVAENDRTGFLVGDSGAITVEGLLKDGKKATMALASINATGYDSNIIDVAAIGTSGFKITAKAAGTTKILVEASLDGKKVTSSVDITVTATNEIYGVKFHDASKTLVVGAEEEAVLNALYTDGTVTKVSADDNLSLESGNSESVSVRKENNIILLKAIKLGDTSITAKLTSNSKTFTATLPIHLMGVKTLEVATKNNKIFLGDKEKLSVKGILSDDTPLDNSAITSIVYTSSNPDIATIEGNRIVSKATGTTTIGVEIELFGQKFTAVKEMSVVKLTADKTRSTIFTKEKLDNLKENVDKYTWAKKAKDTMVQKADQFVNMSYEELWSLMPSQMIPRGIYVNQTLGCLECGTAINNYGNYPYTADVVNEPWKLTCPNCKSTFPTNNFEAYYKGGLDEYGNFDPVLAKAYNDKLIADDKTGKEKGNLVNLSNMHTDDPNWGVDDGTGYIDENGKKFTFVAYYAHWSLWHTGIISQAMESLKNAYIYTGDIKYANAGIVLLDRFADIYPDMSLSRWRYQDGYANSNGNTNRGKVIGNIWETGLIIPYLEAYDAFYPALADNLISHDVLDFLTRKNPDVNKSSCLRIRRNIEDDLLRQIFPAFKNADIQGNNGMHQSVLALAAVILDTFPETQDWLEYNFKAGEATATKNTGGNILTTFVNDVDRDGAGNEGSSGYNGIWLSRYKMVADYLKGYELKGSTIQFDMDLYKNVKFQKMFKAEYPLILSSIYCPTIGDDGKTGNPLRNVNPSHMLYAYAVYKDPVFAQVAYLLNGNSSKGLKLDIFSKNPEGIAAEIQNVIDTYGELDQKSSNLTGFGFAAHRDGERGNAKVAVGRDYVFGELTPIEQTKRADYYDWSGVVQFECKEVGDTLAYQFETTDKQADYSLNLKMWTAPSYGIYNVTIDGGTPISVSFTGSGGIDYRDLGIHNLAPGIHTIKFVCTARAATAAEGEGWKLGIHTLTISELDQGGNEVDPKSDTQRDIWMYYGINDGHGHKDTLNLGLHAFGIDLMPDLGYPEYCDVIDKHRASFVMNTISHNTVVVNEQGQLPQIVSQPKHFDDSSMVKLMDVEADVYSQTSQYKRTVAMIRVDDENSYVVDLFRVKGGNDHVYSFHGAEGNVTTSGLNLIGQKDANGNFVGSLAGADKPWGELPAGGNAFASNGYYWFDKVEKDTAPASKFSVDYSIKDTWNVKGQGAGADTDIHLKTTMLGNYNEVTLVNGTPPRNKPGNPESLKYVLAKRHGSNLDSIFTSVIEPYKGETYIADIEEVPVTLDGVTVTGNEVKALKVTLKNGRIDYIVNAMDTAKTYRVADKFDFSGFYGMYSEKNKKVVATYINDGTTIGSFTNVNKEVTGKVLDFTKDLCVSNKIIISCDQADVKMGDLAGRFIYAENDGVRNASYKILDATKLADGRISLNIGDTTLIRKFIDNNDFSKGYVYDLAEGAAFRIPLSAKKIINSAPTSMALSNSTIHTSAHAGTTVGTITVTDSDDTAWTFELMTQKDKFVMQKNALMTKTSLAAGTYTVRVKVTDSAENTYEQDFTITVEQNATPAPAPTPTPKPAVDPVKPAEPALFKDVGGHWAKEAMENLAKKGIIKGYGDGTVRLNNYAVRAEFVTMIARALGRKTETKANFNDIDNNAWYAESLAIVTELGLVKGRTDGSFGPNEKITRQEAMVIISRVIAFLGIKVDVDVSVLDKFADGAGVAGWAKEDVAKLVSLGVVKGFAGKIRAEENITRGEICAILNEVVTNYMK